MWDPTSGGRASLHWKDRFSLSLPLFSIPSSQHGFKSLCLLYFPLPADQFSAHSPACSFGLAALLSTSDLESLWLYTLTLHT